MKKTKLYVLLFAILFMFAGCANNVDVENSDNLIPPMQPPPNPNTSVSEYPVLAEMEAVVLDVYINNQGGGSISIFVTDYPGYEYGANDLASIHISKETALESVDGSPENIDGIMPGQLISVSHSGVVQEIYPPNYPEVYKVKILGKVDEDLYNEATQKQDDFNSQF